MNFDNPYWIDLKVTYEYYQVAGRLPEFYKKHVCTKCQSAQNASMRSRVSLLVMRCDANVKSLSLRPCGRLTSIYISMIS